ncbi:MAG TPA: SGNH/GDSL hydrolase family protein [Prolixibacteraceae bacterium]
MKIKTKNMKCIKLYFLSLFVGLSLCAQSQDWAELNHYKEDNKEIGLPSKGENRVVFMGNSITAGWVGAMPEFFKGKPYIGRGIGGQTTPQMLIRFRQDVIHLKPKVVVILAGTNDIAGNTGPSTLEMIEDNIASMSELAESNGIKVILSSVLPVYVYPWKPEVKPIDQIIALNHWLKDYAEKNGHIYLDYYSSMVDERLGMKSEYSADGVHPNQIGYKVMGVLVEIAIASTLKK